MANYYYVKHDGTATGDAGRVATTPSTGSFATKGVGAYYATINGAFGATTAPAAGDVICVSDAHSSLSLTTAYTFTGSLSGEPVYITTVSDANCDTAAIASAVQESNTLAYTFNRMIYTYGLWLKTEVQFKIPNGSDGVLAFYKSVLELAASNDTIQANSDGSYTLFVDCTWKRPGTNNIFYNGGGTRFDWFGGTIEGTFNLVDDQVFNGGVSFYFDGVDISGCTGYICGSAGGNLSTDDGIDIRMRWCKMNASLTAFVQESFKKPNQRLLATNCSSSSAGAEYQYHLHAMGGNVDDETSFYRDDSTAFPSTQKISLKVVTGTVATFGTPLWFDIPARFCALSSSSTDLIRIYILSATTLTDKDIWAEAIYPDGTNKQTPNRIDSVTAPGNPLRTGSTLTTNSEAWTGRTTENRYQIDIDTSGDAGADSVPIIRVYIARASTTLYLCPTLGLS